MADLKLNDLRKYAIDQEASIFIKSPRHERSVEIDPHGLIHWVRTEQDQSCEWFPAPVKISFEEILEETQEFVLLKPRSKPVTLTREKFTGLIALKPGAASSQSPTEED